MRDLGDPRRRERASRLAQDFVEELLGLIHNLFTDTLLIRLERVQGKIPVPIRQGK